MRIIDPKSRTEVGRAIEDAVDEAEDVLLIYYAGHAGIADSSFDLRFINGAAASPEHQSYTLSEIRTLLRPSRARRKVLILDCCYAGQADSDGPIGSIGSAIEPDDGWAIVMAAGPMSPAGDQDGTGYTAFTGKMIECIESGIDAAAGENVPEFLPLGRIFDFAQIGAAAQRPRWTGNRGFDIGIMRNPRWLSSEGAQLQQQWELAAIEVLRASHSKDTSLYRFVPVAARFLASEYFAFDASSADPWRPPRFALQMSQQIGEVLRGSAQGDLAENEALALSLMPFIYAVWWDRAVHHIDIAGNGNPTLYRRFTASHQTILERQALAERLGRPLSAAALDLWLMRTWIVEETLRNKCDSVLQNLVDDLGRVAPIDLHARELETLLEDCLKALLDSADSWAGARPGRRRAASRRARMILVLAQKMALDPFKMPYVLDHVSDGSLNLVELHRMDWSWETVSRSRRGQAHILDLEAHPESPEMLSILRAHVQALDDLVLRAAASPDPELPLTILSTRFTATGLTPARDEANQPRFSATEMRFTLDEPRVRELLMGARIYSRAGIAFRELYQNALDACRRRERRVAYRNLTDGTRLPYLGKISFRYGQDNGRDYVECEDNGVGMGEQELATLFARGGARYTRSSEYLEEQAEWESVGLTLHPNSAFGIGVFSYFMVADEMRITTHRYPRLHEREDAIEVHVGGPGSLFHIRPAVRGDFGTTVRLYLKDGVEPDEFASVLKAWVWTSDYDLHVSGTDSSGSFDLLAHTLSDVAPVGGRDREGTPPQLRAGNLRVAPAGSPEDTWWCNADGWALRDGLWISYPLFGAVVNLSGEKMPALTVDRNKPLDSAATKKAAESQLTCRIDELIDAGDTVLSNEWLGRFATESSANVAERIFDAVLVRDVHWTLLGNDVDVGIVGCFIPETEDDKDYGLGRWDRRRLDRALSSVAAFGARVREWRASAWVKARMIPGMALADDIDVKAARPADALILGSSPSSIGRAREYPETPTVLDVLWAAEQTGLDFLAIRDRLAELGFDVSQVGSRRDTGKHAVTLCSLNVEGRGPWLDESDPVPFGHLITVARELDISHVEAGARLTDLGFVVKPMPEFTDEELLLFGEQSSHLRSGRWREPGSAINWGEILSMTEVLRQEPEQIVTKLEALGYAVPTVPLDDTLEIGLEVMSLDLDARAPWLDPSEEVPVSHVLGAAKSLRLSCAEIASRLQALGFQPPANAVELETEPWDDRIFRPFWEQEILRIRSRGDRLGIGYLARAAEASGVGISRVAARFVQLGFRVSPGPVDLDALDRIDVSMLSAVDLRREDPPPGTVVSLGEFLAILASTSLRPAEAAVRLSDLGFQPPHNARFL